MDSEQSRILTIFERLSMITEEISAVAKNLEVGFGQNKYKAVGEADVLAAVKPIERRYGVYSYPMSREIVDSGVLENIDSKGNIKKQLYLRIKTVYKFVNLDDSSDFITTEVFSDGVDPQDKAPGKAMTYGDKYALLKAYKIITGEDPDQYASEPLSSVQRTKVVDVTPEEVEDAQRSAELAKQPIGTKRAESLRTELINNGADPVAVCEWLGVSSLAEITEGKHLAIIKQMSRVVEQCPMKEVVG